MIQYKYKLQLLYLCDNPGGASVKVRLEKLLKPRRARRARKSAVRNSLKPHASALTRRMFSPPAAPEGHASDPSSPPMHLSRTPVASVNLTAVLNPKTAFRSALRPGLTNTREKEKYCV